MSKPETLAEIFASILGKRDDGMDEKDAQAVLEHLRKESG